MSPPDTPAQIGSQPRGFAPPKMAHGRTPDRLRLRNLSIVLAPLPPCCVTATRPSARRRGLDAASGAGRAAVEGSAGQALRHQHGKGAVRNPAKAGRSVLWELAE